MLHGIQGADIHLPVYLNSEIIHCFNSTHRAKADNNSIAVHYGTTISKLVWKIHTHSENQVLTNSIATGSLWNSQVKIVAWKIHAHFENQVQIKKEGGVTRM